MEIAGRPVGTDTRKTAQVEAGGSIAEAILGAVAAVLAVIGLTYGYPFTMASGAAIAVGAALLLQGGAVAARYSHLLRVTAPSQTEMTELGSGLTGEMVGGVTGVVLGVLALFGIYPSVLIPIAVIVIGASLIMASGINDRLNAWSLRAGPEKDPQRVATQAVVATTGLQILVGLGAVVLGIVALTGPLPLVMSLIGLLALGIAGLLSGTALGSRVARLSSR